MNTTSLFRHLVLLLLLCITLLSPANVQADEGVKEPLLKSFYMEFPDGHRTLVTPEILRQTLTIDSVNIASVDIKTLLQIVTTNDREAHLEQKTEQKFKETTTGALIPEHVQTFSVAYPLLEKMILRSQTAPGKKTQVLRIPGEASTPKLTLERLDGTTQELSVVAHGVSDFSGSTPARIHNIKTALAHFQGARIDAGATFSFNTLLGEVDGSTGYMKELVIKGDRTLPDYGGGVCQVSSTVYRAALNAGFPIIERKPHSYAVSYYLPWGTDATIYPGVIDLRFQNDLSTPVYMHLSIAGTNLHTYFYGQPDGRKVLLKGPNTYAFVGAPDPKIEYVSTLAPGKRVWKEYGHNGFSAWWEREITTSTGSTLTEKILSTYEPRGGFVLEGKGMEVPLPE
ncbi:hypothetical protein COW46_00460 [Candidatus Gracilibacteria bacterium CG17_big_fil_post_rev_8_21_14_2_50_48_13]|nr:MAG: hypothetical protein COW46_00460 [Candidatus Gracilibacteria bacterium CG17_big_fil_post_rev_8_21_14_2_50_48_13]